MIDKAVPAVESSAASRSNAWRLDGGGEPYLQTLLRLASAPAAKEADIWAAIDALTLLERWSVVLEIIEQHEFDLDPWRMTRLRARALFELGWHRRALDNLVKAYGDGYVRGYEAVELLVDWGALALAAGFIDGHMSGDLWRAEARTSVTSAATRTCTATNAHDAPFQYADAIQARNILSPGQDEIERAMRQTRQVLTAKAGERRANYDPAGAALFLAAAVRLYSADRSLLESLADAAHSANMTERYLDTLLRIWTTHREAPDLLAIARSDLETSSWVTLSEIMAVGATQAGLNELDAVTDVYRERACHKVDQYIVAGDVASGLELVITVSREFPGIEWPRVLVARLLNATKRWFRTQQVFGDALVASLGPRYLELSPSDLDVCRMMAHVHVRQRRLTEARELLDRLVAIGPHVAGDWISLAMVQTTLGDLEGRDLSVARALLIDPDVHLPRELAPIREHLGLI
jgi:hypothetical protein